MNSNFGNRKAQIDQELIQGGLTPSSIEQLLYFWDKYKHHKRSSQKCYLDARYFSKVLYPFEGLVDETMHINIHHGNYVELDNGCRGRPIDFEITFDKHSIEQSQGPLRLIKVVLAGTTERDDNIGTLHTNLIFINLHKKQVVRFEPIHDEHYTHYIDGKLKEYFGQILPEYHYKLMKCHPQALESHECPSRGMGNAYILKLAMILIAESIEHDVENICPFNYSDEEEEERIMRFADAIETEYGPLIGSPEMEFGIFDKFYNIF